MKIKLINTHGTSDFDSMRKVWNTTKSNKHGGVGAYDYLTVAHNDEIDWNDFVTKYSDVNNWPTYSQKKQVPMLITGELYETGGQKTIDNIKSRSGLIFDFDQLPCTREDVIEKFKEYEFFMYASTGNGNKAGLNCRIILPFGYDVTNEEWTKRIPTLKALFPKEVDSKGIGFDTSAFTISQGQCVPALITGTQPFAHYNQGKLFDFMALEAHVQPTVYNYSNTTVNINASSNAVQSVLQNVLDTNSHAFEYDQLKNIVCVLKNIGFYDASYVEAIKCGQRNKDGNWFYAQKNWMPSTGITYLRQYTSPDFIWPDFEKEALEEAMKSKEFNAQSHKAHLNVHNDYDHILSLQPNQYLNDIRDDIISVLGNVTLLDVPCGGGKSTLMSELAREGLVLFAYPLNIIGQQNAESNNREVYNNYKQGAVTWQGVKNVPDSVAKDMILVIDEAHGMYLDNFKDEDVREMISNFPRFKKVVLMSGTVKKEYLSNVKIDCSIKVNKELLFKKVINRRYVKVSKQERATNKDVEIFTKAAVQQILMNGRDRKVLIYVNSKKQINTVKRILSEAWDGYKLLTISAEHEDVTNPDFIKFTKSEFLPSEMNEKKNKSRIDVLGYNGVIGTNSLCEGININDECEEADVHIIGYHGIERIEQVTNRFRKCSGTINVYHYFDPEVENAKNYSLERCVKIAEGFCELKNEQYEMFDEVTKARHLNTYGKMFASENIYFDSKTQRFEVSYLALDFGFATQRMMRSVTNAQYYFAELAQFGFVCGGSMYGEQFETASVVAEVKAEMEEHRVSVVKKVMSEFEAITDDELELFMRGFNSNIQDYGKDIETLTRRGVSKLFSSGMNRNDIITYLKGVESDEMFYKKVHSDRRDAIYGNEVTRFIISKVKEQAIYVDGKCYITGSARKQIAQDVVSFVYHNAYGDMVEGQMIKLFGNTFTIEKGQVKISNKNQTPKDILNGFIQTGSTQFVKGIDRSLGRVCEIISWNRSGLSFDGSVNNVAGEFVGTLNLSQILNEIHELRDINDTVEKVQQQNRRSMKKQRQLVA